MLNHFYQLSIFGEEWFTYPKLYSEMVSRFPSGSTFVEVGCWKGRSAAYMCVEIANSNKDIDFYCVDFWEATTKQKKLDPSVKNLYNLFLTNLKPVEEYFKPLKLYSSEASRKFKTESIDFVFIDAAHEYSDVKEDILSWYPKIKKGGILAGHDYFFRHPEMRGVFKAVNELFPNNHEHRKDENCFVIYKE